MAGEKGHMDERGENDNRLKVALKKFYTKTQFPWFIWSIKKKFIHIVIPPPPNN